MTQPVQEPTPDRTDQHLAGATRQLFRRPAIVNPTGSSGGYLQAQVHHLYGEEWRVLTDDGNYSGGNGSDAIAGSWVPFSDLTAPWGGYIETNVDDDWIAFSMPNLGPQFTGYGVAVWFLAGPDFGDFAIEWATSSVDEAGNTPSGPIGSATSVVTPQDVVYWGAPAFSWYNAQSTFQHDWRVIAYNAAEDYGFLPNISPFWIGGVDGTMLTANASGGGDWSTALAFNGGGGPDIAWWCRIRVNGKQVASSGYRCRIAGVRVYRLSGDVNVIG